MAETHEKDLEHLRSGEAQASLAAGLSRREVAARTKHVAEQSERVYHEY